MYFFLWIFDTTFQKFMAWLMSAIMLYMTLKIKYALKIMQSIV